MQSTECDLHTKTIYGNLSYCLIFTYLQLVITHLVSSNFSYTLHIKL
jgi:hypothetical protein